jgi:phage host-nuclease inhibitor protein Gam
MSKNRIKIKLPQISSRVEAEATVGEIANCILNRIKLTAQMDARIVEVRKAYEMNLSAIESFVESKTEALRIWAEANPQEFPKDRKSIDLVQGIIGFRTGTPKLVPLNRRWTWEKILTALQTYLPAFLRDRPEIDKASILAQRDEPLIKETLPLVGLKVVQDEEFYVEPKLTEVETRQTAHAE